MVFQSLSRSRRQLVAHLSCTQIPRRTVCVDSAQQIFLETKRVLEVKGQAGSAVLQLGLPLVALTKVGTTLTSSELSKTSLP